MRQTARFRVEPGGELRTREELLHFMHEVNVLARGLSLPRQVSKRADGIVTDAASIRLDRITPRPVLAAAALYVACREFKEPVTLRELAEATGTDPREVGRSYATILDRMHITRPGLNGKDYVHHLALKRQIPEESYRLSEEIIRRTAQAGLGGRNPMTLAAAALYMACCSMGEKVTQAEVADAAGVGEESVRECCKAIRSYEGGVPDYQSPASEAARQNKGPGSPVETGPTGGND